MPVSQPEKVPLPVKQSEDLPHVSHHAMPELADCPSTPTIRNAPSLERVGNVLRLLRFGKRPVDHVLLIGRNTVGRHPNNDVMLSSGYVSRWHCAILVDTNGQCSVEDLGSTHGVIVNGERISELTPLSYGDEIR